MGACGRTRHVTLGLPSAYPAQRPAEGPQAALTAAVTPLHKTPPLPPSAPRSGGSASSAAFIGAPAESSGMTPRVTSRGWNGLERQRVTSPAGRAVGGASGRARVWRSVFNLGRAGRVAPLLSIARAVGLRLPRSRAGHSLSTAHTNCAMGYQELALHGSCKLLCMLMW